MYHRLFRNFHLIIFLCYFYSVCQAPLLDTTNTPSLPFMRLLAKLGIPYTGSFPKLSKTIDHFQSRFHQIFPLLEELGYIYEIPPAKQTYTYALILCGITSRVRTRLTYLVNLWKKGVRCDHLIFLTKERPLDPNLESEEVLLDPSKSEMPFCPDWVFKSQLPVNEQEMVKLVYEQADLPNELRQIPVSFISTPAESHQEALKVWLANDPKPGNCLIISNQPFISCHQALLTLLLPSTFPYQVVGPQAHPATSIDTYLATLDRQCFAECQAQGIAYE